MADQIEETLVDQKTEAPTAYVSPAEDVRNDVAEAIKKLKGEAEPEPAAEAAPEHPEPVVDERPRAPDGKFVAKDKAEAAPEQAAPAQKSPPVDNTATPSVEQPSTAVGAAPVSWAADAKSVWATLPPAVQQAVAKREAEMASGGRQWSEEKRRYEGMIAPVAQEAARLGMQPDQAINALMAAHHALQRNAPAAIAQLAQQYGVDLTTLASNPPAPQEPRFDPMVSQLTQHVTQLESQLSGFLQNQTMGVVEKFAQDHPHYEAVEEQIAQLIPFVQQSNPGLSPQEVLSKAYDQAIWSSPDVRAKLIQEQTESAQKVQVEQIQLKATNAKKAAVSIKGSSNGAPVVPKTTVPGGGDIYDDVRAAIHQLRNN